jgi:GAF domain-containing protein
MFEQVAIAVTNEQGYAQLHALIDSAFDDRDVEVFLNRVRRARLRMRDFEGIIERGLFGREALALYKALPVSDQALTRERYLWLVEQVPAGLRQRYLKLYAYY